MAFHLPTFQPDSVQSATLPAPNISTNVSPSDFGAGFGAGLQSLGHDEQAIANEQQAIADQSAIAQARASMDSWDTEVRYGKGGLAYAQGKAAMDRSRQFLADRKKQLEAVSKSLTPMQQHQFGLHMQNSNADAFEYALRKDESGSQEYADETKANAQDAYLQKISASAEAGDAVRLVPSAGGPVLLTSGVDIPLAEQHKAIDAYFDTQGWRFADPDGQRATEHAALDTMTHVRVIDAYAAKGEPEIAQAYFKARGSEIEAGEHEKIQAVITQSNNDATIARSIGAALLKNFPPDAFDPPVAGVEAPTVTERTQAALAALDADPRFKGKEPGLLADAKSQLKATVKAQAAEADAQRSALADQLEEDIRNGRPWEEVRADSRMSALSSKDRDELGQVAQNKLDGKLSVTTTNVYNRLNRLKEQNPQAFGKLDIRAMRRAGDLSDVDASFFEAESKRINSGDAKELNGVRTRAQAVSHWTEKLYPDAGTKDAAKGEDDAAYAFRSEVEALIAAQQATLQRELTPKEIDDLVGPLFSDIVFKGWVAPFDDAGKLADIDNIPKADLLQIYSVLREDGEVTDEAIQAAWAELQEDRKRNP